MTSPIAPRATRPRTTASAPIRRSCEFVPCRISSSRNRRGTSPPARSDELLQPRDLGVEPGAARLQRVLDPQRRAGAQRREPQPRRAHRRAGEREHHVHADGAEVGRLPGHVRARDEEDARAAVAEPDVVRHRRGRGAGAGAASPSTTARRSGPGSTISGNGSSGCSYAYPASDESASSSAAASSQPRIRPPLARRHRSTRAAWSGVQQSAKANGAKNWFFAHSMRDTVRSRRAMRARGALAPPEERAWSPARRASSKGSRSSRASSSASTRSSAAGRSTPASTRATRLAQRPDEAPLRRAAPRRAGAAPGRAPGDGRGERGRGERGRRGQQPGLDERRRLAPRGERRGVDRGADVVAQDREVLPQVEARRERRDRALPGAQLVRRRGREEPRREPLLARAGPGRAEELEQRALPEEIEILRVRVRRIGERVARASRSRRTARRAARARARGTRSRAASGRARGRRGRAARRGRRTRRAGRRATRPERRCAPNASQASASAASEGDEPSAGDGGVAGVEARDRRPGARRGGGRSRSEGRPRGGG